jgi:1-acyl-sn-glycerol-3-phosphate acyltransferase
MVWRPRVIRVESVPRTGPVILASNHLSFSDSVVLPLLVPRRVTFLAKSDYFTGRGVRGRSMALFFRSIGAVPVRRTGRRDDAMDALGTAGDVLRGGGAFAMYPEGTRSRDGRLYRGRTGVAWLAIAAGTPIVPIAMQGTQRLQPIGARLRLHRIRMEFGTPIDPAPYAARLAAGEGPGKVRRELTDVVMDAIAAMSGQECVPRYNVPPDAEGESTAI